MRNQNFYDVTEDNYPTILPIGTKVKKIYQSSNVQYWCEAYDQNENRLPQFDGHYYKWYLVREGEVEDEDFKQMEAM